MSEADCMARAARNEVRDGGRMSCKRPGSHGATSATRTLLQARSSVGGCNAV